MVRKSSIALLTTALPNLPDPLDLLPAQVLPDKRGKKVCAAPRTGNL